MEDIEVIRHSMAHLMAYAVQELYKDVKFGIGPAIDKGFYYDFDVENPFEPEDLQKIEDKMRELLKKDCVNKKLTISGGEPLMQADAVYDLICKLEDFDIALYTGHEREDVPHNIIKKIRYLKAGRYITEQRTTIMPYVGSVNQRFEEVRHAK